MNLTHTKLLLPLIIVAMLSMPVAAHDCFKDPFAKKYGLKTVSCKTCHPDSKKETHNRFGIVYVNALDGKNLTAQWKKAQDIADEKKKEAAVAAIEKTMVAEFETAMEEVEGTAMTFKALLAAGLINGVRLEKPDDGSDPQAITLEDYKKELEEAEKADGEKDDAKKDGVNFVSPDTGKAAGFGGVQTIKAFGALSLLMLVGFGLYFAGNRSRGYQV